MQSRRRRDQRCSGHLRDYALRYAVIAGLLAPSLAWAVTNAYDITVTTTGATVFVPLHKYYMAPTGSDSNNGLSPASAWATPNHSMVCGDVIVAAPGSYGVLQSFGNVSNCPSNTAGIDGTGGIYFAVLLCGGASVGDCSIDTNIGGNTAVEIHTSNWAIEGWKVTGNGVARAYESFACTATTRLHHHAFINDIAYNSAGGYDTNDCGLNHNVPGNGTDYWAVVGSVAQNSAQDQICLAAIDFVGPANWDALPGTHAFIHGNFSYNNQSPSCVNKYDGENYMIDTLDAHGYAGQVIVSNNIGWNAMRYSLQMFYQSASQAAPTIKVYNNTFFGDVTNTGTADFSDGEINFNVSGRSQSPWTVNLNDNISRTNRATSGSGATVYALVVGGALWPHLTNSGNVLKGMQTRCSSGVCDPGFNEESFNGNPLGSNIYVDPAFRDTADLLANRTTQTLNCSGFANVTACMGYDANTRTLTTPSVISDLVPTATGIAGKGYQLPSTACAPNPDYPAWLKGIVYLQVSGSQRVR